jgi:molecular chaperone GrpE
MYDSMGRRVRVPAQKPQQMPTVEDFEALAKAYKELQGQAQKQARELVTLNSEIAVKDEALKRQGDDLKQTQSELLWTKAALQQAQQETEGADKEGWRDRYLRLQAEVENLRRRWEQRAADETAEARRAILRDMLPLADHLELALQHSDAIQDKAGKSFAGNIETTLRAFLDTLRRYGVEPQQPQGQAFDPALHEAVGQLVTPDTPPGHVAHVVQTGYMEGDKLLRPARVLVSAEQ